ETLHFASILLSAGARLKDITAHISQLTSVAKLKLWGVALSRIHQHPELGIISTYITIADILQTGASEEDIAGIATLLSSIPSEMAVIALEMPSGEVQVRMRTKSRAVNLSRLTSYLGGGGQKKSAGFSFKGSLNEFITK
ncbi:MAG TPA: DHHA1 domain-containing protein, partial [Patescibacteria group bacterium]